ncbi:electron transfer flavoprotein subunit alpha/FixB family protein [Alkalibacter saccharofermentans]|uniref:Electron transfer flavoprotein alpha subunit apoprotein n=1 Tax=Alkalibacter saccharofermentans DSM 14828 TaxID=1120975 RepID=A0A1M4UWR6_9FIRM|nr:electron transfer flavoprotein subunit alpha/FixB family protein [Alkalibacter saccharofermentans]SHE61154.1 electron transfer flavoprotein alpha subunit apoprotein [Alkalibacter saccharofermentans DSM 14828]
MKRCLIYVDSENIKNSMELLEVARQIYKSKSYESYCVIVNSAHEQAIGLFDNVIKVDNQKISLYDFKTLTDILLDIHRIFDFDLILIPGTWAGRMLAPRLAVRLHTGLTADVTEIRQSKDGLELVRPAFSGRLLAGIKNKGEGPIMLSVRQNIFKYEPISTADTKLIKFEYDKPINVGIKQISVFNKANSYDIRDSKILISGGAGVGGGFNLLQILADELGGTVSASRQIVDRGIANRHIQVGQSGKTVSPTLYMALGIFGAIQHVEGLKNVENIISVNTNRNAPICSISDIVVEGEAIEFINMLIARIRKYKSEVNEPSESSKYKLY